MPSANNGFAYQQETELLHNEVLHLRPRRFLQWQLVPGRRVLVILTTHHATCEPDLQLFLILAWGSESSHAISVAGGPKEVRDGRVVT